MQGSAGSLFFQAGGGRAQLFGLEGCDHSERAKHRLIGGRIEEMFQLRIGQRTYVWN